MSYLVILLFEIKLYLLFYTLSLIGSLIRFTIYF